MTEESLHFQAVRKMLMLKNFRFIRIHLAAAAVLMGGILVLSPMAAAEPSSSIYDASGRYLGRIDADGRADIWEKRMQTDGNTMLPVDTKDVRTRADAGTMPPGALPAAPMQTGASMTPQDVIKDGQIKTAGAMTRPAGI